MICSICKVNQATMPVQHMVDGAISQLDVCETCATKHGFSAQLPLPLLADFLFGVGTPEEVSQKDDHACPVCHMYRSDFHKASLLGCPACYQSFRSDIDGLLEGMHKGNFHLGKVPLAERAAVCMALRADIIAAEARGDDDVVRILSERLKSLEVEEPRPAVRRRKAGVDVPREL